jgi:hypothetical protein
VRASCSNDNASRDYLETPTVICNADHSVSAAELERLLGRKQLADNKQIKSLGVFDATRQEEIEKILQIRHFYAHQNGLVDERFREYFPAVNLNDEYRMTLDEFLARVEYLARAIDAVDQAA